MSGLMLFGSLSIWLLFSVAIATWIVSLISMRSRRVYAKLILIPMLFLAPITDEVIAWPQLERLCKGTGRFEFGPGIDEQKAQGRTVYYRYKAAEEFRKLFPGVEVRYSYHDYVDARTGEVVLRFHSVMPIRSWFAFPDAGGSRHPWLLSECWSAKVNSLPDERSLRLNLVDKP